MEAHHLGTGIDQRVVANFIMHHLFCVFFIILVIIFPSFSVLLNCLYLNLQVLPFFPILPVIPLWEVSKQLCAV